MKRFGKEILLTLLVTLAVWAVFSWPLPREAGHAIPSSAYNIETGGQRAMIPGDHLQFLYHFWLAADTAMGRTPLFHNLYEFNTGDDSERYGRSTYYLPFSLFFILGNALGGQAAGWNLTGFLALWITYFFTRRLLLRFTPNALLASGAALISIALPYQWINLLDGSPTGLGMMWVPVIFWSLDILVAEKKMWAGAVAGAALFLTGWNDTHVFFFTVLAAPCWCLFSHLFHFPGRWPRVGEIARLLKASLPLAAFIALIGLQSLAVNKSIQSKSTLGGKGRSLHEVSLRSPEIGGVFRFHNPGDSRKIYLGYYLVLLLLAGGAARLLRRRTQEDPLPRMATALLLLGLLGMVLLATGVRNPGGPRCWALLTKLIPPYSMIRQPDKIYLLMPALLSVAAVLLWPGLLKGGAHRWWVLLLVLPLLADYKVRIHPTLCLLDTRQGAYEAVAEDARVVGQRPHILALPLWPGDSHYNSLNEYYVSLYRIRMVNGYGGSVKTKYLNEIFLPFADFNKGYCSDEKLDDLLRRGVGYLILHEDVFPEKVSPFPVGYTLQRLLNHPRLQLIGKDAAAWSFKILAEPVKKEAIRIMPQLFPARRWEFERSEATNALPVRDDLTALGGGYLAMSAPEAFVRSPEVAAPLDEPLAWWIRLQGDGELGVATVLGGTTSAPVLLPVKADDWAWQRLALPRTNAALPVGVAVSLLRGAVDLDSILLAGPDGTNPAPGESLHLPAPVFFHAGYTTPDFSSVVLRRDYEPAAIVFYGPKLPLEPGAYTVELSFETSAPEGTVLGELNARWPGNEETPGIKVLAGQPAILEVAQPDNKPVFFAFRFDRAADVTIHHIRLTRVK